MPCTGGDLATKLRTMTIGIPAMIDKRDRVAAAFREHQQENSLADLSRVRVSTLTA